MAASVPNGIVTASLQADMADKSNPQLAKMKSGAIHCKEPVSRLFAFR